MRIRAICLSDLHFGSETSVLTAIDKDFDTPLNRHEFGPDINRTSPVLKSLVACLKCILDAQEVENSEKKPSLVLAGDVLELALATTNVAASVFAQFIKLIFHEMPLQVDPTIIYIPGNHDHHFWETSRELQYASYLREPETKLPLRYPPWHATHLFPWREGLPFRNRNVKSFLLNELVKRIISESNNDRGVTPPPDVQDDFVRVLAMYPNFGILSLKEGCRCTVIHHGHFTEPIYHLMTKLRTIVFPDRSPPEEIWDVEAENYAWIDFFWGTLGRSGKVGEDVAMAYNMLKSKKGTRRLIRNLARSIPKEFNHPRCLRWIESLAIRIILYPLVNSISGLERHVTDFPLSSESEKLLEEYIDLYVQSQLKRECRNESRQKCGDKCDKDEKGRAIDPFGHLKLTFVFGHTHKPHEWILPNQSTHHPIHVYNAGGWVVDTIETAPKQGGAIVVIDEDGYAASIRMYNQSDKETKYRIHVESADDHGGESNPLCEQLRSLIQPEQPPWSTFSERVAKAVEARHENLRELIE